MRSSTPRMRKGIMVSRNKPRSGEPANPRPTAWVGEVIRCLWRALKGRNVTSRHMLALTDDLVSTTGAVPVFDWQLQELARRKANLLHQPASGVTWEEVKRRVRRRYGR
ncbi:MAG: addiction module protein [Terriglobia bacterium]